VVAAPEPEAEVLSTLATAEVPPPFPPATEYSPDTTSFQQAASIASDELERIRTRLRQLRERAEQSGVLSSPAPEIPIPTERAPELKFTAAPLPKVGPPPASLAQPLAATPAPPPQRLPQLPTPEPEIRIAPPTLATKPPTAELAPLSSKLERPTFQAPDRGLSDRLGALASWACVRLDTQDIVLVDDFGDVLWGSPGHTALVLSGMMAWHSSQRSNPTAAVEQQPQSIDQELPGGKLLTIIPARTRYGTVSLAAIRESTVDAEDVEALHRALIMAVEGPG
jgi:hypothetical protein